MRRILLVVSLSLLTTTILGSLVSIDLTRGQKKILPRTTMTSDVSCTSNPWQNTTSMTTKRVYFATVQAQSYVYALGGQTGGSGPENSVERALINADGSLGSWQATTLMNVSRPGLAAVTTNRHIYALGGAVDGTGVERAVINNDGSLGIWEVMTPMTAIRYYFGAVQADNYIYALGGLNGSSTMNSVERAAIDNDGSLSTWQTMSSMNASRYGLGTAVAGGYIYAVGGNDSSYLSSVERAIINPDGTLGPWQFTNSMNIERSSPAVVASSGYLYALGGINNEGILNSVERAVINPDGSLGAWQFVNPMNTKRYALGAIVATGHIYALGGSNGSYLASVEQTETSALSLPADYSITINDGALFTNQTGVTLTIRAKSGTTQMLVSNDGGFSGAEWEPCVLHKAWEITQYGNYVIPRVVYVRFRDSQDNTSGIYQDDIILDVTPPTGTLTIAPSLGSIGLTDSGLQTTISLPKLEIKNSEPYTYFVYLPLIRTPPPSVKLYLAAQDDVSGVGGMIISNNNNFSEASWEPFVTTRRWYVPSLTGTITVYARFRDNAGNVSSVVKASYTPQLQ